MEKAGIQKASDLAHDALAGRWEAGARAMRTALGTLAALPKDAGGSEGGLAIREVRADTAR